MRICGLHDKGLTRMSDEIHRYAELKQRIHEDLRIQHPEWVHPDGNCPKCEEHEARLRELLDRLAGTECDLKTGRQVMPEK